MKRKLAWGFGALGVVLVCGVWFVATQVVPSATGYGAKILCSAVFVAGRDPADVLREDLAAVGYIDTDVDREEKLVRATVFGVAERTAVWRPGLGCTLAIGVEIEAVREQGFEAEQSPPPEQPWPVGDVADDHPDPAGLDRAALDAAVAAGFKEDAPDNPKLTRAVVVVHDGRIVAERYADGFTPETPHLGWSMTKSITNALVGIMVHRGELDLFERAPVQEWVEDERFDITIDELLRMSSGLAFEERYGAMSDVTRMLFEHHDSAALPIAGEAKYPSDNVFAYSSGTTNVLCRILRDRFDSIADYHRFPRDALFGRIGMRSAVFEPDPSGTLVGSSFMYATARDWARFGLLYLNDGVWNGERILPERWVEYSATPTPTAKKGEYGAHFWTNAGPPGDPAKRRLPSLPIDAYQASGFQGQAVLIVPSYNAVIVRLGMTHDRAAWSLDTFAAPVLAALPNSP